MSKFRGAVQTVDVDFLLQRGRIHENLSVGADVASTVPLRANHQMSFQGVILVGEGFRLSSSDLNGLGINPSMLPSVVKKYIIGRDLAQIPEDRYVIDFYGLDLSEVRELYPDLLQKVMNEVKPARDVSKDRQFRENWWLWGRPRPDMRDAILGLPRYIGTCRTATHRVFVFLDADVMPDAKVIAVSLADGFFLGVLSSRIHVVWSRATGAWLGVGNDSNYNHSECFAKFPFPAASDAQRARIRAVAEELDAHRKRQQAAHPRLTLTDIYNVLDKLRRGEVLSAKERQVHEQGLVSVLRHLHDELDALVADAYGWPATLRDDEILARLVALNAERAAEEAAGVIRWLRPAYQSPSGLRVTGYELPAAPPTPLREATAQYLTRLPWPERLAEQAQAVRGALSALEGPATVEQVAAAFVDAPAERVAELLETLASLGQVEVAEDGRFTAG